MRFVNAAHPDVMTATYRLYAAGRRLLYVGVAEDFDIRFAQHAREKSWWPEVESKEVIWYDNRLDAEYDEARAIREESPVHNRRGGIGPIGIAVIQTKRSYRDPLADVAEPQLMISQTDIDQYFGRSMWDADHFVLTIEGAPAGVVVPIEDYRILRKAKGDPTDL